MNSKDIQKLFKWNQSRDTYNWTFLRNDKYDILRFIVSKINIIYKYDDEPDPFLTRRNASFHQSWKWKVTEVGNKYRNEVKSESMSSSHVVIPAFRARVFIFLSLFTSFFFRTTTFMCPENKFNPVLFQLLNIIQFQIHYENKLSITILFLLPFSMRWCLGQMMMNEFINYARISISIVVFLFLLKLLLYFFRPISEHRRKKAKKEEHESILETGEDKMQMVMWMCGTSLKEKKLRAELAIGSVLRRNRLKVVLIVMWETKEKEDWVRKCMYNIRRIGGGGCKAKKDLVGSGFSMIWRRDLA